MYKKRKKKRKQYVRLPKDAYSKHINIECSICGRVQKIYTSDRSLYTEKVLREYVCWRCKDSGKDGWYVRLKKAGLI